MAKPLRAITEETVDLVKSFEGIPDGDPSTVNLDAYLDPVGIWTIGWGHAIEYRGSFLRGLGKKSIARRLYPGGITRKQAEELLRGDLIDTGRDVLRAVTVPLADRQFGALVSFTFNLGAGSLHVSRLLKVLNFGDYAGAAEQFLRWTKGTDPKTGKKKQLPGLVRRRAAERNFFLGLDWREE